MEGGSLEKKDVRRRNGEKMEKGRKRENDKRNREGNPDKGRRKEE